MARLPGAFRHKRPGPPRWGGVLLNELTEIPALILGRRMDILAGNPLAAALITDFESIPERHRNYVRITFTDPAVRSLAIRKTPSWLSSSASSPSPRRLPPLESDHQLATEAAV